jgi:hypothetical protein
MIVYSLLWSCATVPCFLIGCRVLSWTGCLQQFTRLGDACFVATWLGLLVLLNLLLAFAPFGPVTPAKFMAIALALSLLALTDAKARRIFLDVVKQVTVSRPAIVSCAGSMVFASFAASQLVYLYDTGLYHYPMIKWLGAFGEVQGLALLNAGFGFVSSWFTLPAAANHGFLDGRITSLANGFVFFLVSGQGLLCAYRWRLNRQSRADAFFLASATIVLIYALQEGFVNSASPDLPIMMLTIIIAWSYLALADRGPPIVPFMLALGATTIKVSALPLLAVTGGLLLFELDLAQKAAVILGAALALLPLVAGSFLATGCFLFPLSLSCIDTGWSVGRDLAQQVAALVTSWARWGGVAAPDATFWNWIGPWSLRKSTMGFEILLGLSLVATATQWVRLKTDHAFRSVTLLTYVGIGYVLVMAPELRFAIGYLCVPPALGLAYHGNRTILAKPKTVAWLRPVALTASAAAFVIALGVSTIRSAQSASTDKAFHVLLGLLRPPPLPVLGDQDYVVEQSGNLTYYRPVGSDQCWDMTLPCGPHKVANGTRLRDPSKGLSAGFSNGH